VKFGISRLSGQRVAPAGKKTHFGPLSKNNAGMAALRAGLPVNIRTAILVVEHFPYKCRCAAQRKIPVLIFAVLV